MFWLTILFKTSVAILALPIRLFSILYSLSSPYHAQVHTVTIFRFNIWSYFPQSLCNNLYCFFSLEWGGVLFPFLSFYVHILFVKIKFISRVLLNSKSTKHTHTFHKMKKQDMSEKLTMYWVIKLFCVRMSFLFCLNVMQFTRP